jgi:hypothetical protein
MSESTRETILLIVQVASLIGLIVYVIKTAEVAKETKKSARAMEKSIDEMVADRDQEYAPYVVVYFDAQTDSPIFDLVVKNTGKSIADNVRISFDPPLQTSLKNFDISKLSFIHQPIPTMPPGFELRTSFDRLENRLNSDTLPKTYKVRVSYFGGLQQKMRQLEFVLDLNTFQGILETHVSSLSDINRTLDAIPAKLDSLNSLIKSRPQMEQGIAQELRKLAEKPDHQEKMLKALEEINETMNSRENKIW